MEQDGKKISGGIIIIHKNLSIFDKIRIVIILLMLASFLACIVFWTPPIVIQSMDYQIPGKYFYRNGGTVTEITLTRFVASIVISCLFILFLVFTIITMIIKGHLSLNERYVTDEKGEIVYEKDDFGKIAPKRPRPSRKSYIVFSAVGFLLVFSAIILALYLSGRPKAAKIIRNVHHAQWLLNRDSKHFAFSLDELIGLDFLSANDKAVIEGKSSFPGYTFKYSGDSSFYEIRAMPTDKNGGDFVVFAFSGSDYLFYFFPDTDIEKMKIAATNKQ